jgi:predicted phosphodiesterase
MRLHVLSDLHTERGVGEVPQPSADVVVLAGDIGVGTRGIEWARAWANGRPVIYVAGNHEYYGQSMPGLLDELRTAAAGSCVHVLEDDEIVIDGVRFLGCSLWSDFDFDGAEHRALSMRVCERAVSDYRLIRDGDSEVPVRPEQTRARHLASRRWLTERLAAGHDGPTVVVTHHAPYVVYRPPEAVLRLVAGAFVSDLQELIETADAELWIYGHTHRQADLTVSGTRLISNPRGYPDELVAGFDPACVVEIAGTGWVQPRP